MILSPAQAKVEAGGNYSIIAHLTAQGTPTLSIDVNDTSALGRKKARLTVRHKAQAPAVDVRLKRWFWTVATFRKLENPNSVSADVDRGNYTASLYPAGSRKLAFGPAKLALEEGKSYIVYAVGVLGEKSFQLLLQTIDLKQTTTPMLMAKLHHDPCLWQEIPGPALRCGQRGPRCHAHR